MTLNHEKLLAAITQIERLTPAPRVLGKALVLLNDPESDIADIATLIRSDPALAADVIRGANSAFYGIGERVSSLDRALQRIGFREGVRLLNLSVGHIMSARSLSCYRIGADDFWAESLFNGLFLEKLAKATRGGDPEEAHTAGLLRFIGRLAVDQCLRDGDMTNVWNGVVALPAWEREQVGFVQGYAGSLLLQRWGFPDEMIRAVAAQDQDSSAEAGWLGEALNFTSTVLPPALGLSFAVLATEYSVPSLPDTAFVRRNNLTGEAVTGFVAACRADFIAIGSNLYEQQISRVKKQAV
ncbi:MAG: HDOD domain-containing protein [Opitutae bacterium]|nr:HDOD domain-containing protein [Opitutae bacterium]